MTQDPSALLQAAACMRCLGPGAQREVQIYLLTQWANMETGSAVGCGAVSNTISITGAGTAAVNQTYTKTDARTFTSADGNWFLEFDGVSWLIENIAAVVYYEATGSAFPCVWTLGTGDSGQAPAPTGQYL